MKIPAAAESTTKLGKLQSAMEDSSSTDSDSCNIQSEKMPLEMMMNAKSVQVKKQKYEPQTSLTAGMNKKKISKI